MTGKPKNSSSPRNSRERTCSLNQIYPYSQKIFIPIFTKHSNRFTYQTRVNTSVDPYRFNTKNNRRGRPMCLPKYSHKTPSIFPKIFIPISKKYSNRFAYQTRVNTSVDPYRFNTKNNRRGRPMCLPKYSHKKTSLFQKIFKPFYISNTGRHIGRPLQVQYQKQP